LVRLESNLRRSCRPGAGAIIRDASAKPAAPRCAASKSRDVISTSRANRRIINALERLVGPSERVTAERTRQPYGGEAMTISDHTTRVFDADLIKLTQLVAHMGGLAQRQVNDAIDALSRRDTALARAVIDGDERIDGLQRQIEEKAVATIALRQPMAIDLRALVAMLRIANDLERIGDLAKNIGKRVIAVGGEHSQRTLMRGLKHMATLVATQLAAVLDSFVDRNHEKALKVWHSDKEVDALYVSLFRELLTYTMEDPGTTSMCIHHLFCAKNIERVGDHATNIAEAVHYMVEGRVIEGERPKGDTSSYPIEVPRTANRIPA
jgi:phosphate transport system protein